LRQLVPKGSFPLAVWVPVRIPLPGHTTDEIVQVAGVDQEVVLSNLQALAIRVKIKQVEEVICSTPLRNAQDEDCFLRLTCLEC
jgi:hypothetical protein